MYIVLLHQYWFYKAPDKRGYRDDIFSYFCMKYMLWVLIRSTSQRHFLWVPQHMFSWTNWKNINIFGWKKCLIWSYAFSIFNQSSEFSVISSTELLTQDEQLLSHLILSVICWPASSGIHCQLSGSLYDFLSNVTGTLLTLALNILRCHAYF